MHYLQEPNQNQIIYYEIDLFSAQFAPNAHQLGSFYCQQVNTLVMENQFICLVDVLLVLVLI